MNSTTTTTNVLASKDVSVDFVSAQLNMVKFNGSVTRLEVEGLVHSGKAHHGNVLPLIHDILLSNDTTSRKLHRTRREWESVEFVDHLELQELEQWQQAKNQMMRHYESTASFCPFEWCHGKLTWKATVQIPADSEASLVHQALKHIQNDADIFSIQIASAPIQTDHSPVLMELRSGWASRDAQSTQVLREALNIFQDNQLHGNSIHGSTHSRKVGQKQRLSQRSEQDMENSFSSTFSANSKSSRRGIRRQRKRNKRVHGAPDYNWKAGAFCGGTNAAAPPTQRASE
ncbi:expressed unknown protein [Seminavis robusta]|uniref:Uncharacterized protein n=1 Tax=Seminavis robusta TaxID=568900 RepID=A0A9N8DP78_9STRA|nr:expressed unknown protein [Seminavis robusta]|eukprot:Sro259_g101280.1 n/a (287) ;mRNA; r:20597-21457